jgi:hypothetical protein
MTGIPSPADLAAAHADLDAMEAEARTDPKLIECWLCSKRLPHCKRGDCARAWRLRDCPELVTEGRASRHEVGGRK